MLVIFDLDGTLLNTLDDIADSMNFALGKNGIKTSPVPDYKNFVGNGVLALTKRALKAGGGDINDIPLINSILKTYTEYYSQNKYNKTKPYDGILDMLSTLKKKNALLGVLSNKNHDDTYAAAENYFGGMFSAIIGKREGYPLKPDPASAIEMCKGFNLKPCDVLYIGDSGVDMETARRAGFYPLGVLWGFRGREELIQHGARRVVKIPSEIVTVYEELFPAGER